MKNPHPLAAYLLELFARRALSDQLLHDLAPGQWVILRKLAASEATGSSPRRIVRALSVDAKSATRCILALERKGYIEVNREGSSESVRLTEAGRLRLLDDPLGWIDGARIRLPPQDKRELCRLLMILLDAHVMDTTTLGSAACTSSAPG